MSWRLGNPKQINYTFSRQDALHEWLILPGIWIVCNGSRVSFERSGGRQSQIRQLIRNTPHVIADTPGQVAQYLRAYLGFCLDDFIQPLAVEDCQRSG